MLGKKGAGRGQAHLCTSSLRRDGKGIESFGRRGIVSYMAMVEPSKH